MKKILFLLLFFVLVAVAIPLKASANHITDKVWVFHWVDNLTVQMTDTTTGQNTDFKGSVINDDSTAKGDVAFKATLTFPKADKCKGERGISFVVDDSVYTKIDTSKPTPIKTGNFAPPGSCTNALSNALVDYLRSGPTIGFLPTTNLDSFADSVGDATQSSGESCESKGGPLGWIMCPLIYAIDSGLNWLDTQIQALLEIDSSAYNNPGLQKAWTQIRNIAYIVLIPIMLVMVIGTALGVSALDAYTVKKALPRMVVAVIFIGLSYYIAIFLINFFNVVGGGVVGLLTSPFGNNIGNLSLDELFGGSIFTSILGTAGVALGAIIALWIFSAPLIIGVGIAFLVLLLRQIFIIALLLVAPLAILAWIFPGNDKLWKSWWGIFWKLLFMFPLIMAIIAVGRIFAVIVHGGGGGGAGIQGGILKPIATLMAWMLPYVFIPFTFKFAGGVFATLTGGLDGIMNSEARRKKRAESRASKLQRIGSENVFGGGSKAAKFGNKAFTWAVYPHKNAMYESRNTKIPFIAARGRRIAGEISNKSLEQSQEVMKHWNANGANDKFYRAVGGMYNDLSNDTKARLIEEGWATGHVERDAAGNVAAVHGIKAKRGLQTEKDFNAMAKILATSSSDSERKAATALQANAAYTGAMHTNPELNYANTTAAAAQGLALHGFYGGRDSEDIYNLLNSTTDASFAHAATVTAQNIGKQSHPENKPGYGHEVINGTAVDGLSDASDRGWAVAGTLSTQDFNGMKGDALKDDRFGGVVRDMLKVGGGDVATANQIRQRTIAARMALGESEADATVAANAKLQKAGDDYESLKNTLLSVAHPQSYASVGVRTKAREILSSAGLDGDLARYERTPLNLDDQAFLNMPGAEPPEGGSGPPGMHL